MNLNISVEGIPCPELMTLIFDELKRIVKEEHFEMGAVYTGQTMSLFCNNGQLKLVGKIWIGKLSGTLRYQLHYFSTGNCLLQHEIEIAGGYYMFYPTYGDPVISSTINELRNIIRTQYVMEIMKRCR